MTAAFLALNRRTFASLKHRNYRLFFSGQVVSVTGTWMQRVAQAWLVLQLTHSPVAVGILALAQFLPFSTFGLFAGVLVDRLDARRTVIATQASAMTLAALLAGLALSGLVAPWHVYVIGFLAGTVQVLDAPARQALTFRMVGPGRAAERDRAQLEPLQRRPHLRACDRRRPDRGRRRRTCFALNAGSFLALLAGLLAMRAEEFSPLERFERPTILRGMCEGFRYVRNSRRALVVLALVSVVSMFAVNNNVLLPVLAKRTLHSGAETFGLLSAFFGAGALLGALGAAAVGRARLKLVLLGAAGFGLAQLLLAPERTLPGALALLLVAGVCFSLWSSNSNSLLQLEAPDHLRGRVVGLFYYGFAGTGSVGGVFAGWLASTGGTSLAFAVAGSVALAAAIGAALALGARKHLPRPRSRLPAESRP